MPGGREDSCIVFVIFLPLFSFRSLLQLERETAETGNEWQAFKGREGEKEEGDNATIQVKSKMSLAIEHSA